MKLISRLLSPHDHARGLAIIRVYLAAHIIFKYVTAWPYLDVMYGPDSFSRYTPVVALTGVPTAFIAQHYIAFFAALLLLAIFMLFGIGGRWTIAIMAAATLVAQKLNGYCLDGGDSMLKLMLVYLALCNSFRYFSLSKGGPKSDFWEKADNCITRLGVASMMLQLAVTYASSGLAKINTVVWYKEGLGLYYSIINERFLGSRLNTILVQYPIIIIIANYLAMFWEASFGLLVWFKRTRYIVLMLGIGMHLGIWYFMAIRSFASLFIILYLVFVPDTELAAIWAHLKTFVVRRGKGWAALAEPLRRRSDAFHPLND